jgi:transposase
MTSTKYIGMDVHKESISIAVMNSVGKVVMECVIETKASTILQFIQGLRGDLHVTLEEGTWAAWLYDLLKPHVTEVVVCNPRKAALLKDGSKSDRIDAHKLAELLYMKRIKSVYHGEHGLRTLKELARSYLTIVKDLTRVMNRLKALYRSWGIPCAGNEVYAPRHRAEWLAKISEAGGPATRRVLLSTAGYLAAPAPGSPAGFIAGSEETQGVETAAPDSGDRSNPGSRPDCPDADAAPLPHQTTTVDLQRSGIRNA